ncbi:MAG: response regulator transcription factor [Micavibrio sp.]|nr:response regulator transcription factor [Micavibrio sp.]
MSKNDRKIQKSASAPHVLIVDDDRRIRELVVRYLSAQGFVVINACDAIEAERILKAFEVDVIILDVMMPGRSGLEQAKLWRSEGMNLPIIMLTALGEAENRIEGLESGVDDYLPKPFEPRELILRLNAILRRVPKTIAKDAFWRIGEWLYDPARDELTCANGVQNLTTTEAILIKALLNQADEIMSREELAEACNLDAGERTIDVQVTRLRRKIEADTKSPRYLQTVRGKGYRLRAEMVGE